MPANRKKPGASAARSRSKSEIAAKPSPRSKQREPVDLSRAVLLAVATNERMNQFLLEQLDERVWDLTPPCGK